MFENLLSKLSTRHTVPVVDEEGRLASLSVTCSEAQSHIGTHTTYRAVEIDGVVTHQLVVLTCREAEGELQELRLNDVAQAETIRTQTETIGTLEDEAAAKDEKLANCERLMTASLPVIFRLGPALQGLLAENIDTPAMTDDGTAVKLDSVQFTVLVLPFQEKVTVRAIGCAVPDRSFIIVNGRVTPDDQTAMIGHIGRIRRAHETGTDPVEGSINLVDVAPAAV
jgi:hypothetical protein